MQKQKVLFHLLQISITVSPPELRTQLGGASKHHSYRITGTDSIGQIQVWRRYSDFVILKEKMMVRWPGVYIPALPQKKFLGNNEGGFVDTRRQGLEDFLNYISEQDYLWYSDEFQLFIKSKVGEVDKILGNLGKTNNKQIATKFRIKFAHAMEQPGNSTENSQKVSQFRAYLKGAQVILQKMAKVAEQMTETRRKYYDRYESLLSTILFNYEDQVTSNYFQSPESLSFKNFKNNGIEEQQLNLFKANKKSPISIVNQLIKQQFRELENFQQILKFKQQFQGSKFKAMSKTKDLQIEQTKINSGKESLLNKIKNANKQQQLRQNKYALEKARQQLKDAEQICQIIDQIMAREQIDRFKQARRKSYYRIVKQMAKAQKQISGFDQALWSKVLKSDLHGYEYQQKEAPKNIQNESPFLSAKQEPIKVQQQPKKQQKESQKQKEPSEPSSQQTPQQQVPQKNQTQSQPIPQQF